MDIERLRRIAERAPALVLMHAQADPDALSSAHLLAKAFGSADIGVFDDLNQNAKRIAELLGMAVRIDPDPAAYRAVAVVDAGSPGMLAAGVEIEPDLVVDHHAPDGSWRNALRVIDDGRTSCTEVVIDILDALGIAMDGGDAKIALAGIIADTGRFRYANARTMATAARLIEGGADMSQTLEMVESDHYFDVSRRIAHLKALQRVEVVRAGDMLVATTRVSAFEASAARLLLQAGADVALVLSVKKGEGARLSGRAGIRAVEAGVHLGRTMQGLAEAYGGWGGGHAGAAGLSVPEARLDEAAAACEKAVLATVGPAGGEPVDDATA